MNELITAHKKLGDVVSWNNYVCEETSQLLDESSII